MKNQEHVLLIFARDESLLERSRALQDLINNKAAAANRKHPLFIEGLNRSLDELTTGATPVSRLHAAANIGRIWSTVRGIRNGIEQRLSEGLGPELPHPSELGESDDRYYLALVLNLSSAAWLGEYQARSAVLEETGEKARAAYLHGLFSKSNSLSESFSALTRYLPEYCPQTEKPGDSFAKRLRRLVTGIIPTVQSVDTPEGEDFGRELRSFFLGLFAGRARPETARVAQESAEACAELVHELVRTRLALVTDVSTYDAYAVFHRWFEKPDWILFASKSVAVRKLVSDVKDAMTLLGRQGVADDSLAKVLAELTGSSKSAAEIMKSLGEERARLHPEVKDWLLSGGRTREESSLRYAEDSAELSSDESLAVLLIESGRLNGSISLLTENVISELSVVEPDFAKSVTSVLDQTSFVLRRIDALARLRNLTVYSADGEAVEFDPFIHEAADGRSVGIRKVKIVKPGVVRKTTRGANQTVLKALVEAAD